MVGGGWSDCVPSKDVKTRRIVAKSRFMRKIKPYKIGSKLYVHSSAIAAKLQGNCSLAQNAQNGLQLPTIVDYFDKTQMELFVKRNLLIFLFVLLLAACGGGSDEAETAVTPEPAETAEEVAATEPPPEPEPTEPVVEEEAEPEEAEPEEAEPTSEPEEEVAAAPPVELSDPTQIRDQDWVKGAENGSITIIEYGDFQ